MSGDETPRRRRSAALPVARLLRRQTRLPASRRAAGLGRRAGGPYGLRRRIGAGGRGRHLGLEGRALCPAAGGGAALEGAAGPAALERGALEAPLRPARHATPP